MIMMIRMIKIKNKIIAIRVNHESRIVNIEFIILLYNYNELKL